MAGTAMQTEHTKLDDQARADWRDIIQFLASSPEDYGLILTMARLHEPANLIDFETDNLRYETARARAEAYLQSAICRACGNCLQPVASYPDGRRLDWPAMVPHECVELEAMPAHVRPHGRSARRAAVGS